MGECGACEIAKGSEVMDDKRGNISFGWLPVNQAWVVLFGETILVGPLNTREEAEHYVRNTLEMDPDTIPTVAR